MSLLLLLPHARYWFNSPEDPTEFTCFVKGTARVKPKRSMAASADDSSDSDIFKSLVKRRPLFGYNLGDPYVAGRNTLHRLYRDNGTALVFQSVEDVSFLAPDYKLRQRLMIVRD